jgi:hypothetical protein
MTELNIDAAGVAELAFVSTTTVISWLRPPASKANRAIKAPVARLLQLEFERLLAEKKATEPR